jgi:hypothetical protein
VRLFARNHDADNVNAGELKRLPGTHRTFAGRESCSAGASVCEQSKLLLALRKGCPAATVLTLGVGARVMLVKASQLLSARKDCPAARPLPPLAT